MRTMRTIMLVLGIFLAGFGTARGEVWSIGIDPQARGKTIVLTSWKEGNPLAHTFTPAEAFPGAYAPALAVAPGGELWVAWAAEAGGADPRVLVCRGRPGEWSPPAPVSASVGWDMTPALALDAAGNPLAAWASERGGVSDIYCARWQGDKFGPETRISNSDTSPNLNPAAAFVDGEASLAWQGWTGERYQVFRSSRRGSGVLAPEDADQVEPFFSGETLAWGGAGGRSLPSAAAALAGRVPPGTTWIAGEGWTIRPEAPKTSRGIPENPRAAAPLETTYIGYGDSITYGTNGPPMGKCYIPLLENNLETRFPGSDFQIYNHGYPGCTTAQLLSGGGYPIRPCPGINSVLASYPASRILIMGGTNDISDGLAFGTITSNLGAMIDRSRAAGVEPVISSVIPRCDGPNLTQRTADFQPYVEQLAQNKGCAYADSYEAFMAYGDWQSLLVEDCVHPVWTGGSQEIADAWEEVLEFPSPSPSPSPERTPSPLDYSCAADADYNGDGTAEIAVFRPASGLWAIRGLTRIYFGGNGAIPVSGDYDGNGTSEIAVFTPEAGRWNIRGLTRVYFGQAGDWPVPAAYSGWDHIDQIAVFRPGSGLWAVRGTTRCYYGTVGDIPRPGYYHPDWPDTAFAAVFRPASGLWSIRGYSKFYFGAPGDLPVPAAYGGGNEIGAVWRDSSGLWLDRDGARVYYGAEGDRPVQADYAGNGTSDRAVFRPGTGAWHIRNLTRVYFGAAGDRPVSGRPTYNPSRAGIVP